MGDLNLKLILVQALGTKRAGFNSLLGLLDGCVRPYCRFDVLSKGNLTNTTLHHPSPPAFDMCTRGSILNRFLFSLSPFRTSKKKYVTGLLPKDTTLTRKKRSLDYLLLFFFFYSTDPYLLIICECNLLYLA